MQTIQFNDQNHMENPLVSSGTPPAFSKYVLDYFEEQRRQHHYTKDTDVCRRIGSHIFSARLAEIFNRCDRQWKTARTFKECDVIFHEAIALVCGIVASVTGIYKAYFAAAYGSYDISCDNTSLNASYISFVLNQLKEETAIVSEVLSNMRNSFEYTFQSPELSHSVLSDTLVREVFYTYFAEQCCCLTDYLNNHLENLKLGNALTKKNMGNAFDFNRPYRSVHFYNDEEVMLPDGKTVKIPSSEEIFIIDDESDACALLNLCTTAKRAGYTFSENIFFFTMQNEKKENLLVSSADIEANYTKNRLIECNQRILVKEPDEGKLLLVYEPEIIIPYQDFSMPLTWRTETSEQRIFFSNPKENHVSFELSLFLPDRHILGESQRIEPGQYVQTIIGLRILPEVSQYENCILQYCCYLPQSRTPCKVCEYSVSVNFTS